MKVTIKTADHERPTEIETAIIRPGAVRITFKEQVVLGSGDEIRLTWTEVVR